MGVPTTGPEGDSLSDRDRQLLGRAIRLGRSGWGRVHPNPMVGAIVARDGRVLAQAFHEEFGGPHAEMLALADVDDAGGTTVYASLEPCNHVGKTGSCARSLRGAGVARVVYWARDPGEVSGGGGAWLKARGLRVHGPFGEHADWVAENPAFFHRAKGPGRPFLALKLAVSLDGRIAPAGGRRVWLTGPRARREVHRLRTGFEAILVGSGTWEADDPMLTIRDTAPPPIGPVPVLLDRRGRAPARLRALGRPQAERRPVVVTTSACAGALRKRLGARADTVVVGEQDGRLALDEVLDALAARGISRVLCEGGGRVAVSLLRGALVDRIYLFVAPVMIGSGGVAAFPLDGLPTGDGAVSRQFGNWRSRLSPTRLGDDTLIVLDRAG